MRAYVRADPSPFQTPAPRLPSLLIHLPSQAEANLARQRERLISDEERGGIEAELRALKPGIAANNKAQEKLADRKDELHQVGRKAQTDARRADAALQALGNVQQRRIQTLGANVGPGQDACKLRAWLDNDSDGNRGAFQRKVHGPIALDVSVKDPAMAHVVEQTVQYHVLTGFVTECDADYRKLKDITAKMSLKVTIFNIEGGRGKASTRLYTPQAMGQLESFGIIGSIEDQIEASATVMQVLRDHSMVDVALVGDQRTANAYLDQARVRELEGLLMSAGTNGRARENYLCYTYDRQNGWERHNAQKSRYQQGACVGQVSNVRQARFWGETDDPDARREATEALEHAQEEVIQLKRQFAELDGEANKLKKEAAHLKDKAAGRRAKLGVQKKARLEIGKLEGTIAELEAENQIDLGKERTTLVNKLNVAGRKYVELVEKAQTEATDVMAACVALAGARMNCELTKERQLQLKREVQRREQDYVELQRAHAEAEATYKRMKAELKADKAEAMRLAPTVEVVDSVERQTALVAQFEELPNRLDELVAMLEEVQRAADLIHDNPEVIVQYQKRKQEIEQEERELAKLNTDHTELLKTFDPAKNAWKSQIAELQVHLNKLFATYMTALGNEGEVRVLEGATMGEYGIQILVRFRY